MSSSKEIIKVFDTTLRDGEQTPGVSVTPKQKVEIASKLDELGVDIIEAGFPIVSHGEMEAMTNIAKQGLKAEICGLARTIKTDIDAVIKFCREVEYHNIRHRCCYKMQSSICPYLYCYF